MKKQVALTLAGVMAMSTLPMSVFASDATLSVKVPATLSSNSSRTKTLFYNPTSGSALGETGNKLGSKEKEQAAGFEVIAAPVIRLNGVTTTSETQFELVMTNGAGTAKWGGEYSDFNNKILNDIVISDGSTATAATVQNKDNSLLVTIPAGLTDASITIPFVGTVSSNQDPLMVTVKPISGDNNIVTSTVTAATVNDSTGGNTTTTIDSSFSGKNNLEFDILTTENNDNALGNDTTVEGFEGQNADNVIYTLDSDYKFGTEINGTTINSTSYTKIPSNADYGLDVEVWAKIGGAANKLDVVYVVNNKADVQVASSVLIEDISVLPTKDATLGEDVYMSVTPKGDSDITKQSSLKVGTYSDYAYSAGLYNSSEEIPALPAGTLAYGVESTDSTSSAAIKDEDLFDADEVGAINVDEDNFDDLHQTATLKVSETVSNSFIAGRDLTIELPEGVNIIGYEIVNTKDGFQFDTDVDVNADQIFFNDESVESIEVDGNELTIHNFTTADPEQNKKASFAIRFYVAADANYTGDVTATVSGDALAGAELEPVTIATMAPAVTLDTKVSNVKSGTQSTTTADITVSETAAGTFEDGETVYIAIDTEDTATLANAIKFVDADVEVTEGDLDISDVKVTNDAITFKVKGESTEASTIALTNVKVSTAYGLPETNVAPFDVVVSTDVDADEVVVGSDANTSTVAYGAVRTPYINIKDGSGALNGDVVQVQPGSTTYLVNGEERQMDVAPFIDATTQSLMVPVRFIADGVGLTEEDGNLIWSANNKTVIIRNGSEIIEFPVGANFYRLNGIQISNENNAVTQIVDGRTFVPFRTMGNALGIPVSWDEETRTAQYN